MKLIDVYHDAMTTALAMQPLYDLLAQRPAEANISHSKMPTPEEHAAFVARKPYRLWFMIEGKEAWWVGAIYATHHNELGVFIFKHERAKGYGSAAIRQLMANYPPLASEPSIRPGHYVAHVAPKNGPSNLLFTKLGGEIIQVTYVL